MTARVHRPLPISILAPKHTTGTATHGSRSVVPVGPELHTSVQQAADAIGRHPAVYQRDGQLVHIARATEPAGTMVTGTPTIRPIGVRLLRSYLSEVAEFARARKGETRQVAPPHDVAAAVAELPGWGTVRPLRGILEAPSLRPDGSLIIAAGYDASTGFVFEPSATFPKIASEPTQAEGCAAFEALTEVFADFPFTSAAARSVACAAVLTILLRPAIRGAVPLFAVDKNTPGTGGTLCADAIAMVATGRPAAKLGWPGDGEELEKLLASCALAGASMIAFDNVVAPLGGSALDRCLTAIDRVQLRILGRSEAPQVAWLAVVMATGNNIVFGGDTSRRACVARLETAEERPEERTSFRHPDLLRWIASNRPRLVAAALTMARAWVVAGRPAEGAGTWGSFEAWAAMVPPIILFCGGANPMLARPAMTGHEDTAKAALTAVLAGLERLDRTRCGITLRDLVARLYPDDRGPRPPDAYDDLRDGLEALAPPRPGQRVDGHRLGNALRKYAGRVVDGRRLVAIPGRAGSKRWLVETVQGGGTGGSGDTVSPGANPNTPDQFDLVRGQKTPQTHQSNQVGTEDDAAEREAIMAEGRGTC
jgi:hypothetical protein